MGQNKAQKVPMMYVRLSTNICVQRSRHTNVSCRCRRVVGKTRGLMPRMIYWLYTVVVRSKLTYGTVVWWKRIELWVNEQYRNRFHGDHSGSPPAGTFCQIGGYDNDP